MDKKAKSLLTKVKRRSREYYARLLGYAVSQGLPGGQDNYTKFIILTRSRSGSNFLVDLLNSHRGVACYSELFSLTGNTYWGVPGYGAAKYRSESLQHLKDNDPVSFLNQYVYKKHPAWISAVGFKLFYNQAREGNARVLWDYLREMEDLKIIHLKRRNVLASVLSRKIAGDSGVWVDRGHRRGGGREAVHLTHEECLEQFEMTHNWQEEFDDFFKVRQKIEVVYEDLVADTTRVMDRVQGFLGIRNQSLRAGTRKQSSKSTRELILNYEELRDSFSATEWSNMFER